MKRRGTKALLLGTATAAVALLALTVPGLATTSGTGRAPAAGDRQKTVRVMDNFFDPRSAGIAQGGKVTFAWKGTNRHNVHFSKVPPGASKKSSRTKRRGHWTRSFSKPGLYRYVCTLFAGMRGTITVKAPTAGEG
jgi:plastocyanin